MASEPGRLLIDEGFSHPDSLEHWWVEGCEKVWVEDGRLFVRAEGQDNEGGSGTIWCKTPHPSDFTLEYDARVLSSSTHVNNINLFFSFSVPGGQGLYETRASRASGRYKLYHELNGYIITYLNDADAEGGRHPDGSTKARHRLRREPGFELLTERFERHCQAGITYHFRVVKRGGLITFEVDGEKRIEFTDPQPWGGGHLGLRTFRSLLWWDNLKLFAG